MRYIFPVVLLFHTFVATAQEHALKGIVKDDAGKPVVAATVSLLLASDSSWIKTEFTDDKGSFLFEHIQQGKYLADVQAIGYEHVKTPVSIPGNPLPLTITVKKNNSLEEVTITANKPFIENGLGKMIVNVGSSVAGKGSNAYDLLRKSPGVVVDESGNISLQGKQGITVLVNERPTYLSGTQLTDYLKTLPSDEIDKLELITQPSAKYDAEGSGGIINIVQKKNRKKGFNGTATVTPGIGVYPSMHNNAMVTWKKNRLNLYVSGNYMQATGFLRSSYQRELYDDNGGLETVINGGVFMKERFSDALLRTGADYDINEKTTAGIMVSGNYHPNTEVDDATDAIQDVQTNSVFYSKAKHDRGFLRKRIVVNAYLKNKPDDKNSIVTNADYTQYAAMGWQYLDNTNEDAAGNILPGNLQVRSRTPFAIDAVSIKSDYTGEYSKHTQLEAGIKSSYTQTDNNAMFDMYTGSAWINDTARTNHFIYRENINAAYASLNKEINNKWKLQCGLRAEHTHISGRQLANGEHFERNIVSLFPTAYAAYTINKKHEVQLNYGRRIHRPQYNALNPFPVYTSRYHYKTGNPALQPQMTHNIELTHVYNNMLTTRVYCSQTNNVINDVLYKDEQPDVTYRRPENIAKQNTAGMSVTMYKKLLDWWELSVMGYGFYSGYYDEATTKHKQGNGYGFSIDSQFVFKNGWRAESHINIMGRRQEGIYAVMEPAVYSSCGVSKKVFKDTGTIALNMEDPFFAYRYNWSTDSGGVEASGSTKFHTLNFGLSFIYNFGSESAEKQREHTSDEVRRM